VRKTFPCLCTAFGAFGEDHLQFNVVNSIENIEKALDRVTAWMKKICKARS
jgi:hypothetical protein